MRFTPTRWGWVRLIVLLVASAVLLIPVTPDEELRPASPVPFTFDTLSGEHGQWAAAGVMGTRSDGTVPLGNKLLGQFPPLANALVQIHGRLFPEEMESAEAAGGDIQYANRVADHIAYGIVQHHLGRDPGPVGNFVTNRPVDSTGDPVCPWFTQGLQVGDVIVSGEDTNVEPYLTNTYLVQHPGQSRVLSVMREGQLVPITLTQACPLLPILVPVYASPPPRSTTLGSAGSSRGLIATLSMLDWSTPGDLTGGQRITGTGEILVGGDLGGVEGVPQKIEGAVNEGYDVFLVNPANYREARATVAPGTALAGRIQVVKATTIFGAIEWLCTHGGDGDEACRR